MVRFALTPPAPKKPPWEPCAAQLTLARAHPTLVPLVRVADGYEPGTVASSWFELVPGRGFAGYGLARALRMLLDLLGSLGALHETKTNLGQPFVHGEVCPELLRIDDEGVTRLVPLAPWHWSKAGTLPAKDRVEHLAPERLLGDTLDHRADVFSAGVLLWEALAGCRLFEHASVETIVTRLMGGKVHLPPLPPELSWALPLKSIAECALSVDPEQRFANCAEFVSALEAVAGEQVAQHSEVAAYFSAPHRSLPVPAPNTPKHQSSLSALTAAIEQEPTPRVAVELRSAGALPAAPVKVLQRARSRVLPLVAAFMACGALGITLLAPQAQGPSRVSAAQATAPLAALPAPSAAVLRGAAPGAPVLTAPSASGAAAGASAAGYFEAPAAAGASAQAAPSSVPSSNSASALPKPVKLEKLPHGAAPARSKPPASAPRMRDREAEQYGI